MERCRRWFPIEIRKASEGDGAGTIAGYAAVFDVKSLPIYGLFREVIKPGAFARTLKEDEQLALWNHNDSEPLGRTGNRTLTLEEDEHGLAFELQLPDTQRGRDAYALVKRGDVAGMSFGFMVRQEVSAEDEEKLPIREVLDVQLFEVSPVTFPAYPATEVEARAIAASLGIPAKRIQELGTSANQGVDGRGRLREKDNEERNLRERMLLV